jgi:hypothetical protein
VRGRSGVDERWNGDVERIGMPRAPQWSLPSLVALAVVTSVFAGLWLIALGWGDHWLVPPALMVVSVGWLTIGWRMRTRGTLGLTVAVVMGVSSLLGAVMPELQPPSRAELVARFDDLPTSQPPEELSSAVWTVSESELPWMGPVVRREGALTDGDVPGTIAARLRRRGYEAEVLGLETTVPRLLVGASWSVRAVDGGTTLHVAVREGTATVQASWSAPLLGTWPLDPRDDAGVIVVPAAGRFVIYALAVVGAALVGTSLVLLLRNWRVLVTPWNSLAP